MQQLCVHSVCRLPSKHNDWSLGSLQYSCYVISAAGTVLLIISVSHHLLK